MKNILTRLNYLNSISKFQQVIFFGTDEELLNRESLLKDFRLSQEDIKINFDTVSSDLVKVDLEETQRNDYKPTFTKIEDQTIKDPIAEYILAKPKEKQIQDIAHQLMHAIGNMYPIADQEIRTYISRILEGMIPDQMRDILVMIGRASCRDSVYI